MRWHRLRISTGLLAGAALLSSGMIQSAVVAAASKIIVNISFTAPSAARSGDPIPVSVAVSAGGVPVAKRLIRIFVDGTEVAGIETNADGDGSKDIRKAIAVGTHTLTASFHGGGPVASASTSRTIVITAAPLTIRVVPYIPNSVTVSINGGPPLAPNTEGFISTTLSLGDLTLNAVVHNPSPTVRVSFVSWSNNDVSPVRVIHAHRKVYTQIAVQVQFLTRLKFENSAGAAINPSALSNVRLLGPDGQQVTLGRRPSSVWLSTPVPRKTTTGALAIGADVYTLTSADYQGINVADAGLDRYVPSPDGVWAVRLDAYPVTLFAKNIFFGGYVSGGASLISPAGVSHHVSLSSARGGTLVVPRGRYRVKLLDGGLGTTLRIRVSRATVIPIPVVTLIDIIILALILVGIVSAIVFLHPVRRWRHRRIRRQGTATPST